MFFIGGTAPGANIEVHDVQFAVVDRPEDAFDKIADNWFGDPKLLHLDGQMRISWVDGYDVTVSEAKEMADQNLFFVHMGGYAPGDIDEKHSYDLIVAKDKDEAKRKALERFRLGELLAHKDILFDVDSCILLNEVDGTHIHLKQNLNGQADVPIYPCTSFGKRRFQYDSKTDTIEAGDGTVILDIRSPAA